MKVRVDETKCIGCGTCASLCDKCFEVVGGVSRVKEPNCESCDLKEVAGACPVEAIIVGEDEKTQTDEETAKQV